MKINWSSKFRFLPLLATGLLLNSGLRANGQVFWTGTSGFTNTWSEPNNWSNFQIPTNFDSVIFDNVNGVTNTQGAINNAMSTDMAIAALSYTAVTNTGLIDGAASTNFHSTLIPPGVTLSVVGAGNIFNVGTGTDAGTEAKLFYTLTGGGNLVVGNVATPVATDTITIGQGGGASGEHRSYLDMSGLNSFTASVGLILIGDSASGTARKAGAWVLAKTNVLRAISTDANGAFRLCHNAGGQGRVSEVLLGQDNTIYTDYLRIGGQRGGGASVRFQSGLAPNPVVRFRGANTTGRMSQLNVAEARGQTGTNGGTSGMDTTGGTLDCLVSTMILGYAPNNASAASVFTATLTMDAGIIDVTSLFVAYQGQNNVAPTVGNLNINGTGQVLAGAVTIGRDAGSAAGSATGTINISNNAVMTVIGNLAENNLAGGSGSSTINLNGGLLAVGGTLRVDNLNVTNAAITVAIGAAITDANPAWIATNLNLATATTLNVQGSGFSVGRYPLIKYTGAIGAAGYGAITLGTLPARTQGYLSNNVANSSIDIVITNLSFAKWNGNVNGNWDTNTANWKDSGTGLPTTFSQATIPGDSAIFDDSATGTRNVNLTMDLAPSFVAFTNSTGAYTLGGTGRLVGTMALVKNGSSDMVLTNTSLNDFSGGVTINAGTLRLGLSPDRLPTNTLVTMADVAEAKLDLGGQDQTISTLTGGGPSGGNVDLGANALTLKNGSLYGGVISGAGGVLRKTVSGTVTLTGANTYSGGTILTATGLIVANTNGSGVGTGPVGLGAGTLLSVGNGGNGGSIGGANFITNNGTILFNSLDDNSVNAPIEGTGVLFKQNVNTVTLTAPSTYTGLTVITNGALRVTDSNALGDPGGAVATSIYSSTAHLELMNNVSVVKNIDPSQKSFGYGDVPSIASISGTNTLSGTLSFNQGGSYWAFRSDAGRFIVNSVVNNFASTGNGRTLRLYGNGDGEWNTTLPAGGGTSVTWVMKHGTGTWTMAGFQSYNGETLAYGGKLVVNGDITSVGNVTVGSIDATHPYVPAGVPATLAGVGPFWGPITVNTNGILSPGTATGDIATMFINNGVTSSGTIVIDVNTDTLAHDTFSNLTSIAYGGTLVINPSGSGAAVTNGASIQIFSAAGYSGSFAAIVPASPGPGLSWDTSNLAVNGTLAVSAGPNTTPTNLTYTIIGNQIKVGWPADHIGWRLLGQTNGANAGISTNWFTVPSSTTTNELYFNVDSANGSVFYRLVYP